VCSSDLHGEGGDFIFAFPDGSYFTTSGASGSHADRDYFTQVVKDGQDYVVADEVISKSLGSPVIVLGKAVLRQDGGRAGMAAFQMKAEVLTKIIADVKIGAIGYAYLVDRRSWIIARPTKDEILGLNLLESAKSGWKGLDLVGKAMQAGETGASSYKKPDGNDIVGYYASVPNSPNWSLSMVVPLKEVNSTRDALLGLLYIVLAAGVVVAILVALLVSRSIVGPIKLAGQAMGILSPGDLGLTGLDYAATRKIVVRGDEPGAMGIAIDGLLSSLSSIVGDILTSSAQVASGSEQMSEMAQGMSQGANEQAASIKELSASVEELASTVR
jgi:methyl-accepting chemotaxis protein